MKTIILTADYNPRLCGLIFKTFIHVHTKKWNRLRIENEYVYHCCDIIDTLGCTREIGKFTERYSDELCSEYSIKLFGIKLKAVFD